MTLFVPYDTAISYIGKYITETVMTGNMYKNIHSSLVYSSYKSEIIQTLINSKMDKLQAYSNGNTVQYSNENEQAPATNNNNNKID